MKDFDYKYEKYKFRLAPYFQLHKEELSWIIYRAYRLNFLKDEDVKDYIRYHKLRLFLHYSFPVVSMLALTAVMPRFKNSFRYYNNTAAFWYSVGITVPSWWVFTKVNPGYLLYSNEKQKLLKYIDNGMSYEMLRLNNLLPRHYTENKVDGFLRKLYNQRNSFLTGILYDKRDSGFDFVDLNETVPHDTNVLY